MSEEGGFCEGGVIEQGGGGRRTLLLAAHSRVPSVATVTLDTDTSSSGISWWEQLFSARSQTLTLPDLSQLMISPWLGCMTTSLAGLPWL